MSSWQGKGSLHAHPNQGCGNPPYNMVAWYYQNGSQFVAITEHDYWYPDPNVAGITALPGVEESSQGPNLNRINVASQINSNDLSNVFSISRANGDLVQFNHLCDGWTWALYDTYARNYDLAEIQNGNHGAVNLKSARWLDKKWMNGTRVWCTCNEDSHAANQINRGNRNYVNAPGNSANDIVTALRLGNFYASNGSIISNIVTDSLGHSVTVTLLATSTVYWYIDDGAPVKTDVGVLSSTYTATGKEVYVRAEVKNAADKWAWTQPMFIEAVP